MRGWCVKRAFPYPNARSETDVTSTGLGIPARKPRIRSLDGGAGEGEEWRILARAPPYRFCQLRPPGLR